MVGMVKLFKVSYVNSAILKGSGRGFLNVTETVDEAQLLRLKGFPFVKALKVEYFYNSDY